LTEKKWRTKVDDLVLTNKAKMKSMRTQIGSLKLAKEDRDAAAAEEKAKEEVISPAKIEMKKLEELRTHLKQASASEVADQTAKMNKIALEQTKNANEIAAIKKVVKRKTAIVGQLTEKKQAADAEAKAAKEELAKAGVRRPSMFMDLGESMKKVDAAQTKDLSDKERKTKGVVKEVTMKKQTAQTQLTAAQQQLEKKQATSKAMQAEIALDSAKKKSATNGTAYQKAHDLDVQAKNRMMALQNGTDQKFKEKVDRLSSEIKPIPELPSLSYHACDHPRVVEDAIIKQFPDHPVSFQEYLKQFTKDAVKKMNGLKNAQATDKEKVQAAEAKADYLQSCEMQANCRAMGNVSGSCNPQTMCSKGNPELGSRPCKTCMTLFKLKRWRELNSHHLKKCKKGEECKSTPLIWPLCGKGGHCNPLDFGRKPNKTDDVHAAETHCTSCFEGDALEIVHPATKSGICRTIGPADGSARMTLPKCYASNAMEAVIKGEKQVCTHIQRPYTVFRGTSAEGWLKGYNEFAYVTCNSRKAVVCDPATDPIDKLVMSASQSMEGLNKETTKCQVESQVSCETACRVKLDGSICKKDDESCKSAKSWTYEEFEDFKTKASFKNQNLKDLDCDSSRCTPDMCKETTLA